MESAADSQILPVVESESLPQCSATLENEVEESVVGHELPQASAVQVAREVLEHQEAEGAQRTKESQEKPQDQETPSAQEDPDVRRGQARTRYNGPNKSFDRTGLGEFRKTLSVGEWSPLENDSRVMTALIKELGVKGVRIEELWSFKECDFENIRPVHGLIFLLKHPPVEPTLPKFSYTNALDKFYFARQVINNACPTQALLSILMNVDHPDIELGEELKKLKNYSTIHEPLMRGIILGDATAIRNVHNAIAERHALEVDVQTSAKVGVQHRFISYMPMGDSVYEMDGLRDMPFNMGHISPEEDWLELIRPIIMHKICFFMDKNVFFTIMAVVSDKRTVYENELMGLLAETGSNVNKDFRMRRLKMLIEYETVKEKKFRLEKAHSCHKYYPYRVALNKLKKKEKILRKQLEHYEVVTKP